MKSCLVGVVFFLIVLPSVAQDSITQRLGLQFSYHQYDFFSGLHYEQEYGNHQHQLLVSVGVNSTFFQRRFYPQLAYQYGFHLIKNTYFQAGPYVRLTSSMCKIDKHATHGMSFNEELFLGAYIGTGNRNRFRFLIGIGPSTEVNWSTIAEHYQAYWTWNYMTEISYAYAF